MGHRVLVLCHGNICRSPAAALWLSRAGLEVRQGGLGSTFGRRSPAKVRALFQDGALDDHRSREATWEDVRWADFILVMGPGNRERFQSKFGYDFNVRHLGEWHEPSINAIKDPNYISKDDPELKKVYKQIFDSCMNFAAEFGHA